MCWNVIFIPIKVDWSPYTQNNKKKTSQSIRTPWLVMFSCLTFAARSTSSQYTIFIELVATSTNTRWPSWDAHVFGSRKLAIYVRKSQAAWQCECGIVCTQKMAVSRWKKKKSHCCSNQLLAAQIHALIAFFGSEDEFYVMQYIGTCLCWEHVLIWMIHCKSSIEGFLTGNIIENVLNLKN